MNEKNLKLSSLDNQSKKHSMKSLQCKTALHLKAFDQFKISKTNQSKQNINHAYKRGEGLRHG